MSDVTFGRWVQVEEATPLYGGTWAIPDPSRGGHPIAWARWDLSDGTWDVSDIYEPATLPAADWIALGQLIEHVTRSAEE